MAEVVFLEVMVYPEEAASATEMGEIVTGTCASVQELFRVRGKGCPRVQVREKGGTKVYAEAQASTIVS